jgi:hypothetical protein
MLEDPTETSGQAAIAFNRPKSETTKAYIYSICGSLIGQIKKLQVKPFLS